MDAELTASRVGRSAPRSDGALGVFADPGLSGLFLLIVAFAFSVHAAFRGLQSDLDALAYAEWYAQVSNLSAEAFWAGLQESNIYFQGNLFFSFETGFAVLTFLLSRVSSSVEFFFFAVTFISLALKFWALKKMRLPLFWMLVWYFSWYYLLLEMTSMRAGLAASIVMAGVAVMRTGGGVWRACLWFLVAVTCHVSAALAFVVPLIHWRPLGRRGLIVLASLGIALSFASLLPLIELAGTFSPKLAEYYQIYTEVGFYTELNRFNVVLILRLALLLFVLIQLTRRQNADPNFRFAASLYVLPIFCFHAFASFPLVAGRVYEFLGVLQVLFIGWCSAYLARPALLKAFVALVSAAQFGILVFHVQFVDFFYFIGEPYKIETEHRR